MASDEDPTEPFSSATRERIVQDMAAQFGEGRQEGTVARSLTTPADLALEQLTAAFSDVSLASVPDARLIIAHPPGTDIQDPAVIRLPQSIGGWDMVGVVQRTHDVRLAIDLPYHDPPSGAPNPRFIPMRLQCSIYYDPGDNDCVLVNYSGGDLYLSNMGSTDGPTRVAHLNSAAVAPGIWRILVKGNNLTTIHLLDFLVLRRQFTVAIHQTMGRQHSSSDKRQHEGLQPTAVKRRRGYVDTTEILVAPAAESPRQQALVGPGASSVMHGGEIAPASEGSLIDLKDGDIAVVASTRTESPQIHESEPLQGGRSYELLRLERIAETASASLFTAQHSALAENIVAKVIKYGAAAKASLVGSARSWEREKKFLEKVSHANIMSLKAFDGRVFALYLEHLPKSLFRGMYCSLSHDDSENIVRDLSAALTYLESQRVVHNDIKPFNIAYSPERGAVLLDFGLAGSISEAASSGGTPWYVPPEYMNSGVRGAPGDIWALAVTMLYVLGKTRLPERASPGWRIRDVGTGSNEATENMQLWVNQVAKMRSALNRTDPVEGLVYDMLAQKPEDRVCAAEVFETIRRPAGD